MAMAGRQHRLLLLLQPQPWFCRTPVSKFLAIPRVDVWKHTKLVPVHTYTQSGRFRRTASDQAAIWRKAKFRGIRVSARAFHDGGARQQTESSGGLVDRFRGWSRRVLKVVGVALLAIGLVVAGTPTFLSWPVGLRSAVSVVNNFIPGTLTIKSASIGWTKPLRVDGINLKGVDEKDVLDVPRLETEAPLWAIATGRAGLGECTIISPVIDLQQDERSGLLRLALALAPEEKLLPPHQRAKKKPPVKERAVGVDLKSKIAAPGGGLELVDGRLVLPADLAAVLGKRVYVDISAGHYASDSDQDVGELGAERPGIPIIAGMWAECVEAKAIGLLNIRQGKIELLKPLLVEADLTPELAQLYLMRVNPLLGDILGPAVRDEDMPDLTVRITPTAMILPADQYKVQIEPMKAILGRGPIVNGVLSLLSKETKVAPANRDLTMQTSTIEAQLDMQGDLECSRMDVLIADHVHLAVWGHVNWVKETMQMTMAIPSSTLRGLLGLRDLPDDYHLKIPLKGTFERPVVDWKAAGVGIAQLTVRQRGGGALINLWNMVDGRQEEPVPQPRRPLPWE